jgi:CRP-like cAMP-binding protein
MGILTRPLYIRHLNYIFSDLLFFKVKIDNFVKMFEAFRKYISDKANLTNKELDMIESLSVHKKLRKRQFLLQEGDVCRYMTFIARGCMRQYRIDTDGAEHITRFAIENWWMSDRESYTTGQPSKSYIDCLEDSDVIVWTKENYSELLRQIPEFHNFMEQLLNRSFIAKDNRIHAAISFTAEEKYHNFLKNFPDIFNRVPLHMIASYLGISRETLSRIRSQYAYK